MFPLPMNKQNADAFRAMLGAMAQSGYPTKSPTPTKWFSRPAGYFPRPRRARASRYRGGSAPGGAAPLPTKPLDVVARRRRHYQKIKKCDKMKGTALKKEVCKLSNQIKELKNAESASLGKMTYRKMEVWNQTCANNVQSVSLYEISKPSNYETVLAQLKYYDPGTPGTLITASAATGTYQKNFLVKNIHAKLTFRNNYQSDADVTVYLCTPKSDSSISPKQAWTDGITTDAGNVSANTEINQYPTDYDVFRDLWNAKRAGHKVLSPGESFEVSHSIQDVEYDPALYDEHAALYQKRFKTAMWMVVLKGTLSHDTVINDELGLAQAGIDTHIHQTWTVQYDAGVNLSYVYLDSTLDSPTTGFVQSHQPIPDNVGYSVN